MEDKDITLNLYILNFTLSAMDDKGRTITIEYEMWLKFQRDKPHYEWNRSNILCCVKAQVSEPERFCKFSSTKWEKKEEPAS